MPTFLGCALTCSISSLSCDIFVFNSACSFSLALCLGTSVHIFLRHASFSSGVCAFLYSAPASRFWGVRLTAMVLHRDCFTVADHFGGLERCYPNRQPDQRASVQGDQGAYRSFDMSDRGFARSLRSPMPPCR